MRFNLIHQIGNVLTYVLVTFFSWLKVLQSVTSLGSWFQILMASLIQVFWERPLFPDSISLSLVPALAVVPCWLIVCLSTFSGWLLMFKDFQISWILIWAFIWFADSMFSCSSKHFYLNFYLIWCDCSRRSLLYLL